MTLCFGNYHQLKGLRALTHS